MTSLLLAVIACRTGPSGRAGATLATASPGTGGTPTAGVPPTPSPRPPSSARPPAASNAAAPFADPRPPCRYAFPVQPAGLAAYGPSHHDYPASDLFAPLGTEVVAPTSGAVDFTSTVDRWDPTAEDPATRGGIAVAIIGDGGVRYYGSHLRDLATTLEPGARVAAGGLLGHVGQTGNARGVAPHLHFGISHPTTPEDWRTRRGGVSPYRYLNAWRGGTDRTPAVPGARGPVCRPPKLR